MSTSDLRYYLLTGRAPFGDTNVVRLVIVCDRRQPMNAV
jgi:hypothetical protein